MPSLGSGVASFALAIVVLTVLIHFGWFSIALALKIGALLLGVAWLYALIRIPWDLYFAARHGRQDGEASVAAGIDVDSGVVASLKRYERQLLSAALASHVISAALMGLFGQLAPDQFHPGFVWLFVLSAGVRPAGEAYAYLARRIRELSQRTRYPREDIHQLIARVQQVESRADALLRETESFRGQVTDQLARTDRRVELSEARESTNHVNLQTRLAQLSHQLESTVSKITEDRELIAGVKAFARMFRDQRP